MTFDELQQHLALSATHSILLDVQPAPGIPGYVRSVELFEDLRVCISFDVHGCDEGGAYFWGRYHHLDDAVRDLADFLGSDLVQWRNDQEYPAAAETGNCEAGHQALQAGVASGSLRLPSRAECQLVSSYWQQFRSDRAT